MKTSRIDHQQRRGCNHDRGQDRQQPVAAPSCDSVDGNDQDDTGKQWYEYSICGARAGGQKEERGKSRGQRRRCVRQFYGKDPFPKAAVEQGIVVLGGHHKISELVDVEESAPTIEDDPSRTDEKVGQNSGQPEQLQLKIFVPTPPILMVSRYCKPMVTGFVLVTSGRVEPRPSNHRSRRPPSVEF